jgi:predicted transcriptional regulator
MAKQPHTSIRYTPEAKRLLELLAKKLGVSQTAVVEMAIREFAEKRGVLDPHADYSLPSAQG